MEVEVPIAICFAEECVLVRRVHAMTDTVESDPKTSNLASRVFCLSLVILSISPGTRRSLRCQLDCHVWVYATGGTFSVQSWLIQLGHVLPLD